MTGQNDRILEGRKRVVRNFDEGLRGLLVGIRGGKGAGKKT